MARCNGGQPVPGPAVLRRLTNAEYLASVRDLLKLPESDLSTLRLAEDEGTTTAADALRVSKAHVGLYFDAAAQLAGHAMSTGARRSALIDCDPTNGNEACLTELANRMAWHGSRQNVYEQQQNDLLTLSRAATNAQDPDPYARAKLIIQGVLQSPFFLYRKDSINENPLTPPPNPAWKQLTSYSIAERMSYLILGSAPDPAVLQEAVTEQLDRPNTIVNLAQQMLQDPRAKEGLGRFVDTWLNLQKVLAVPRDKTLYPDWTDAAAASALEETRRYVQDFMWTNNQNFLDLFSANYSYINESLSPIYEKPGAGFERVTFAANDPRGGLLTQPSILAASVVGSDLVSPILRGKFVRDVFLCSAPPLPGVMVPALPTEPGLSIRERLDAHRADPACKGCHDLLDPVGYGLEQFDLIGRYRTRSETDVFPGKGRLYGLLGDPEFTGAKQLQEILKSSNATSACIVKHLQSYTFGRAISQIDACTVADAFEKFRANNYDIKTLIVSIASSDAFRFVSGG